MSGAGIPQTDLSESVAAMLPLPVLVIGPLGQILFVNPAAEQYFGQGTGVLVRQTLDQIVPPGSALLDMVAQAGLSGCPVAGHDVQIGTMRWGERVADVSVTPMPGTDGTRLVALHERSFAQRLDRQLLHRGAARSLNGMAAVLAHEIKNPLAGIRGAAQLLEESLADSDRELTRLICDESDRISALIDRMETFGDGRASARAPINIHEVLDRARKLAQSGFAREIAFAESFDPSLPHVSGDRDRLIQVFVNLVRNASDAVPAKGGEIVLATAFRPGMRMRETGRQSRRALPLEVTVRDNGAGIASDLLPLIFDAFVTTKTHGAGLGLALVAQIVGDHGGIVECESEPGRTLFRVLLPAVEAP